MIPSLTPAGELPRGEYALPGPLRDQLVSAILDGRKTATTSLLAEYDDDPIPGPGWLEAVVDSHGRIVCVTRVTEVSITPLSEVDEQHARDEGEDFEDVAAWQRAHTEFWRSPEFVSAVGQVDLTEETFVVCVRFEVDRRYPTRPIVAWTSARTRPCSSDEG